jgi:hypothetical protein
MRKLGLFLFVSIVAYGQIAHPRIWLDSGNLTRLQALLTANDPSWIALKAHADSLLTMTTPAYGYVYSATFVGGGTFSGTGTCSVAFDANSMGSGFGATGTLTVMSGTPTASIAITSGGARYFDTTRYVSLGPVTATLSSGTATCNGSVAVKSVSNNTRNMFVGSGYIKYDYQGGGWYDALLTLGLAYKVTGTTSYATQVIALMDAIATSGPAVEAVDSGYPSRYVLPGFAIGYDWVYDQLETTRKTTYASALNALWVHVKATGYEWAAPVGNGCGNYFGGHAFGFGLAAIAFEGDASNAKAIMTDPTYGVLTRLNSLVLPQFARGCFAGGTTPESYSYGGGTMLRYLQLFWAMQTSGKSSLLIDPETGIAINWTDYAKTMAKSMIYQVRPDLWAITDEGDWAGSYARILFPDTPYRLSFFLTGTTEGKWMNWLYANIPNLPDGTRPYAVSDDPATQFLFKQASPTLTSYSSQPLSYLSIGDYHTIVRSDWTSSAIHTTFSASTIQYTGHQMLNAGHVSIQRGSDYLLVNAGQWAGGDGYVGNPQTMQEDSVFMNAAVVTDPTVVGSYANCMIGSWYGNGCQTPYNTTVTPPVTHKESKAYAYSEANLRPAYSNRDGNSPFTVYHRSFLNIGGTTFLFDRMKLTNYSIATRKLAWHYPANATVVVNGNVASISRGSSTLWIHTVLPASPTITTAHDMTQWGGPIVSGTKRFEVSDPSAAASADTQFLTVLAPTASSVSTAPLTSSIITSGFVGALYDDGTAPKAALFSADGTAQSTFIYGITTTGTVTHVIVNLAPTTYTIRQNGTAISAQTAGVDGTISFTSINGGTFSSDTTTITRYPPPPRTHPF